MKVLKRIVLATSIVILAGIFQNQFGIRSNYIVMIAMVIMAASSLIRNRKAGRDVEVLAFAILISIIIIVAFMIIDLI